MDSHWFELDVTDEVGVPASRVVSNYIEHIAETIGTGEWVPAFRSFRIYRVPDNESPLYLILYKNSVLLVFDSIRDVQRHFQLCIIFIEYDAMCK